MRTLLKIIGIDLFLILVLAISLFSNNLQINNISLEDQNVSGHYCFVEFDIAWNNSWNTAAIPQNHDAAWVFIKYRVAGGDWLHATLHSSGYSAPSGSTIDIPQDSVGAFIYRSTYGYGANDWNNARLRWDYGHDGVADDAPVEVVVLGIEMVYIPQGAFYLGDGSNTNDRFHVGDDSTEPYLVNGNTIRLSIGCDTCLYAAGQISGSGTNLQSAYPTGYNAFYAMKYEVSQKQYVDFLNSLNRTQQNTRTATDISAHTTITHFWVMSVTTSQVNRNGIRCDDDLPVITVPVTFYCDYNDNETPNELGDGLNIVCNHLNWTDIAAYADWAGLRPMTELEYEEMCRGPNSPVDGEYAWGTTNVHGSLYGFAGDGTGSELIVSMATNTGNMANGVRTTEMVLRCGIFAASSVNHSRQETGAGYYGVMELSGSCKEMTVTIGNIAGRSFTGLHGDGSLDGVGNGNVGYWPGINGNSDNGIANGPYTTSGISNSAGSGSRGGDVDDLLNECRVSNREYARNYTGNWARHKGNGGRLVRTAP